MKVLTESGLELVLERTRAEIPNDNGELPTVTPAAYGGPIMGPWGSNGVLPPTTPWQGWPIDWNTGWFNGTSGQLGSRCGIAATCADLNSRQMASFPVYCMQGDTMCGSPPWADNPEPSLYAEWGEAMKQLVNSIMLRGEAFVYATGRFAGPGGPNTGHVARWAVLNPDQASVRAEDE